MFFKTLLIVSAAILTLSHSTGGALAADMFTFGYSGGKVPKLIINGTTSIDAMYSGSYDNRGKNDPSSPDYIAGVLDKFYVPGATDVTYFHDYFVFDLGKLNGSVKSAALTIYQPSDGYMGPVGGATFTNYDVSTSVNALTGSQSTAKDIYADLGSGVSYASTLIKGVKGDSTVKIALNAAALGAITGAEGKTFAIGGRLDLPAVPLPASLPMFGAALLALAGLSYRAKRKNAARI